jgi:hypothetical protein
LLLKGSRRQSNTGIFVLEMIAQFVSFSPYMFKNLFVSSGVISNDEECRMRSMRPKNIQYLRSHQRMRGVVNGQGHNPLRRLDEIEDVWMPAGQKRQ